MNGPVPPKGSSSLKLLSIPNHQTSPTIKKCECRCPIPTRIHLGDRPYSYSDGQDHGIVESSQGQDNGHRPIRVEDWMMPIIKYLESWEELERLLEARRLRQRVANYILKDQILYKRGYSLHPFNASAPRRRSMCSTAETIWPNKQLTTKSRTKGTTGRP